MAVRKRIALQLYNEFQVAGGGFYDCAFALASCGLPPAGVNPRKISNVSIGLYDANSDLVPRSPACGIVSLFGWARKSYDALFQGWDGTPGWDQFNINNGAGSIISVAAGASIDNTAGVPDLSDNDGGLMDLEVAGNYGSASIRQICCFFRTSDATLLEYIRNVSGTAIAKRGDLVFQAAVPMVGAYKDGTGVVMRSAGSLTMQGPFIVDTQHPVLLASVRLLPDTLAAGNERKLEGWLHFDLEY